MRPASARRSTSTEARRAARPWAALGLALVGLIAAAVAVRAQPPSAPDRQEFATLAAQVDVLDKRNDLASGDAFYLILDPAQARLQLMLKGAVLREYKFVGLDVGVPRIVFRSRKLTEGWQGRIWSEGNLVPPRPLDRIEIVPPDSTAVTDSTKQFVMPPTPEEKYPVPPRYHIRYAGGLSLEVRPRQLDTSVRFEARVANALRNWYRDFRAAISDRPEDTVRLRLVLQPDDAASLYRAMPPATRLLVLPAS